MKQSCVLAPVLFKLFFTCVLRQALQNMKEGIYMQESIFDLLRPPVIKAKTNTKLLQEVLFVDDYDVMTCNSDDLQTTLKKFSQASKNYSLTICLGKTEALLQPAPIFQLFSASYGD
ncbi:hypothetical protein ElyMa_000340000 [Elysia marginata]|uniref:Reverse transcriptase domain-containing protein n=1 Tax=Elysia marginata TaxID=1093978 RepID=A0AAV4FCJ1_9GAST|nr:hypothetical protein ElyMa_000340000 [Elysia marginata]